MDGNNGNSLAVALGLACLSLGVIYVVFGPDQPSLPHQSRRKRKAGIQINGLENTGSNCYVNVIVQALASSDFFIDWLKESLIQQELFQPNLVEAEQQPAIRFIHYLFSIILRNNAFHESIIGPSSAQPTGKFCAEKTLTFQLLKLLQGVNGKHSLGVTLNASRLLQILYNFNFESRNEQQDAHELFNFLTSSLENEILRTLTIIDPSLNGIQTNNSHQHPNGLQIDQLSNEPQAADWATTSGQTRTGGDLGSLQASEEGSELNRTKEDRAQNIANEYVPIKRSLNLKRNLPTKGLLAHQMCCLRCDHKFTIQFESFHSISLPLVPRDLRRLSEPITLHDCLNAFVSREILKDVVCENCRKLDRQSAAPNAPDGTEPANQSASTTRPKMKSTFVKRLTFAKLPQLLVIHLQRLVCLPSGMPMKKEDRVRFPSILVMDEYEHYAIQQRSSINILSELNWSSRPSALNARSDKLGPSNALDSLECSKDANSFADRQSNEPPPTILLNGSSNAAPMESTSTKSDDNHHPDHHASLHNNEEDVSLPIASSNSSSIKQANDSGPISASSNNAKSNDVTDSVSSNCCSLSESGVEGCNSGEPNGGVPNSGELDGEESNSARLNGDEPFGGQCNGEESSLSNAEEPVRQQTTVPTVSAPLRAIGSDTNPTNRISSESACANNSPADHLPTNEQPKEAGNCSDCERPDSPANNGTTGDRHKATTISAESETKATDEYASGELSSNKTSSNSIKLRSDLMCPKQATPGKEPKYRYKLNASIVHLGSCFSGHYIGHRSKPADANRSNEQSGDWYFTSDSVVRPSSLEDALQSNGYMLFYERIK